MKNKLIMIFLVYSTQSFNQTPNNISIVDIPEGVHAITVTTLNNNAHRIIIHDDSAQVLQSPKTDVNKHGSIPNDLLKEYMHDDAHASGSQGITIINDNKHTITHYTMHPTRSEHTVSPAPKRTWNILPSFISASFIKYSLVAVTGYWLTQCALLTYYAYAAQAKTFWNSWHEQLSLKELQALEEQKVAVDIFYDIRAQHLTRSKCSLMAWVNAMQEIEKEIKNLTYFIQFHEKLTTSRCAFAFPCLKDTRADAQTKLQRLNYISYIAKKFSVEYVRE